MKAFQKFVQLSFILVVLMTMMGFRMSLEKCADSEHATLTLLADAGCCCKKSGNTTAENTSCTDMLCLTQSSTPYAAKQTETKAQVGKSIGARVTQQAFTQFIRPELLAVVPHFTLPPPNSGRFLGIFHQQFNI